MPGRWDSGTDGFRISDPTCLFGRSLIPRGQSAVHVGHGDEDDPRQILHDFGGDDVRGVSRFVVNRLPQRRRAAGTE